MLHSLQSINGTTFHRIAGVVAAISALGLTACVETVSSRVNTYRAVNAVGQGQTYSQGQVAPGVGRWHDTNSYSYYSNGSGFYDTSDNSLAAVITCSPTQAFEQYTCQGILYHTAPNPNVAWANYQGTMYRQASGYWYIRGSYQGYDGSSDVRNYAQDSQ